MFLKHLRITIISLILFTILTGMIYPLAVTGISQLIFPGKANGSLIKKEGKVLGSELIGQPFSDPKYLLEPAFSNWTVRIQCRIIHRIKLRAFKPCPLRRGKKESARSQGG